MGKKIVVYTPGVWDLLHVGHLNLLERAKLMGDHLVVGVCSDRLVHQTKGAPVITQDERAKLLLALGPVDEIHVYDSLDQRENLALFNVDVFCVGEEFGCYDEHVLSLKFCEENNVQVKVLKRYPGISSTALRGRVSSRAPVNVGSAPALAVDYHDCLTFDALFFKNIFRCWHGRCFILSGTRESDRQQITNELRDSGLVEGEDFEKLILGYEYDKNDMSINHFMRMREYKLLKLRQHDVKVFFDDNPYYVEWIRNHGITTFQLILPDAYMEKFAAGDPFFSCHLQRKQFQYLSLLSDEEVTKRKTSVDQQNE